MTLKVGSLFSGIGGLELGGPFETLWQAERDPYARAVLAKHWPHATRFTDVQDVTAATVPAVDVLCGGFPCQPHSLAGKRLASNDERDLWGEFARIAGEIGPRWVVAENVPGLLSSADPAHGRGNGGFFGRVLRDLAHLGYDAEWHSIPAAVVGAPHLRYRVFLIAYRTVAHASSAGREEQHAPPQPSAEGFAARRGHAPDWAGGTWEQPATITLRPERGVRDVADGIFSRVDELRALGNAVVPQVAAIIGRAICEAEEHRRLTAAWPAQIVTRRHLERT